MTTVSKTAKLKTFLESGNTATARQITSMFGLKNPHEAVRQLRNQGVCVYANKTTLRSGEVVAKYRVGKPTRGMVAIAAGLGYFGN